MFERPPIDADGSFRAWLARDADVIPPGALYDRVLEATASTRRRPAWFVLERWLPMPTRARFGAIPRSAVLLLVLGMFLAATAALRIGSPPSTGPSSVHGPGAFAPAPPMTLARASHTATLMPDGRILVTGGENGGRLQLAEAEIRDPITGSFEATGSMALGRRYHTATLLSDGHVLVTGGGVGPDSSAAEVWDPATERFSTTGPMAVSRHQHTGTLLDDGRVLLVGGSDSVHVAELWDPATGKFTPTGAPAHIRAWHEATLLTDGRVLVTGGARDAELWDPATGSFEPAGMLVEPRVRHTATLLGDGSVLLIGGMAGTTFGGRPIASVERWDPETMTFTLSEPLAEPRAGHIATLLPDGRVLVAGGDFIVTAEIWDPETGSFDAAGSMTDARSGHTATLLPDGRVVVMGGYQEGDDMIASTETWDPLVWTTASTDRDWPGPLRPEPASGPPIVVPYASATDGGGGEVDYHYPPDTLGEESVAAFPWLDITDLRVAAFDLATRPGRTHPSDRWVAYGLVVDRDRDGVADVRIGMDNAPGGEHRAWRTDLVTGETIAQTGPPYGRSPLPDTYFPGEVEGASTSAWFHHAFAYDPRANGQSGFLVYAWASQVEDGRIVATDYAPDTGWIDTRPDG